MLKRWLPFFAVALLTGHFLVLGIRSTDANASSTLAIVLSAFAIFAFTYASAIHIFGLKAGSIFAVIGVVVGWGMEQIGTTQGFIFGSYEYTDVLGPRLLDVPFIIGLMWFALAYMGYIIANLIVWQKPHDDNRNWLNMLWVSLLAGFIVTAYDLAADPYFVHVLKAWTIEDGSYFGETAQGFFGWVLTTFLICMTFRLLVRKVEIEPLAKVTRLSAMLPVLGYLSFLIFFVSEGFPSETKSIAFFAMGIPVIAAVAGFQRWAGDAGGGGGAMESGAQGG